jgi:hypothetical protein
MEGESDDAGQPKVEGGYMSLTEHARKHGWPLPDEAPAEWLALMAKVFNLPAPLATLGAHSSADWLTMYRTVAGDPLTNKAAIVALPGALAPAKARLDAAKAAAATAPAPSNIPGTPGYDPFA